MSQPVRLKALDGQQSRLCTNKATATGKTCCLFFGQNWVFLTNIHRSALTLKPLISEVNNAVMRWDILSSKQSVLEAGKNG